MLLRDQDSFCELLFGSSTHRYCAALNAAIFSFHIGTRTQI
ncbi:hypothetical protein T07_11784 [Trichinella nelsoni]|uniref:Uncharacterized protein n=1 Tax=Trichinella nelsoni TaxID=6336 RepID=A0A0V0RB54_9BILA|nr:hypothetical protein T07_11784 [Trichinella nelsoni]